MVFSVLTKRQTTLVTLDQYDRQSIAVNDDQDFRGKLFDAP